MEQQLDSGTMTAEAGGEPDSSGRGPLREVAGLFLRLGATSFGGPAAHIAFMEDEVVRRRGWLTRAEFLDLLGAVNLIPGPNSTELAIHIGHRRAGWPGLVVAGVCFIVPATLIVSVIAWMYVRFGALPAATGVLAGVKPVIIAVILQALFGFGRTALKSAPAIGIGLAALAASLLGVQELLILLGGGVLMPIWQRLRRALGKSASRAAAWPISLCLPAALLPKLTPLGVALAAPVGLWPLFLFFLKVGSVLFGSGYVLLAFLRSDLVERLHWLTQAQLLDAIAVGQFTPGPVFTTATFIGGVLGGVPSALVATAGIFLPAFVFVALSAPLVPRLRRSPIAGAVLDGINVASLAIMAAAAWGLGCAAITGWGTVALLLVSLVLLLVYRINSAWLVLGGAVLGWLTQGA